MQVTPLMQSSPHNAYANEKTEGHWLPCPAEAQRHQRLEEASQAERLQQTGWPKATGLSMSASQASVWCECAELQLLLLRLCCSCA